VRKEQVVKKLFALVSIVSAFAVPAAATGAATTPVSPGACHMLDANARGLAGMDGSSGGKNMVPLVFASLDAECTP
jgi:hypothetical protein